MSNSTITEEYVRLADFKFYAFLIMVLIGGLLLVLIVCPTMTMDECLCVEKEKEEERHQEPNTQAVPDSAPPPYSACIERGDPALYGFI